MAKSCKVCGSDLHTAFTCSRKPRQQLRARKRMKRVGKVTKTWMHVRDQWIAENPPDYAGYYYCYIPICGLALTEKELTLDHMYSRSRHPELRFDLDNLAPCCTYHNKDKGSLDIDEYLIKLNTRG